MKNSPKHRVELRRRSGSHRDTRLERRQLQRTASVERNVRDIFPRDDSGYGVAFVADLRGCSLYGDDLAAFAHAHCHVNGRCAACNHLRVTLCGSKTLQRGADLIIARRAATERFFMSKTGSVAWLTRVVAMSLVLLTGFALYAQAPAGTITGSVTDSSGAVIPGAAVVITDKATNTARDTAGRAGMGRIEIGRSGAPRQESLR